MCSNSVIVDLLNIYQHESGRGEICSDSVIYSQLRCFCGRRGDPDKAQHLVEYCTVLLYYAAASLPYPIKRVRPLACWVELALL